MIESEKTAVFLLGLVVVSSGCLATLAENNAEENGEKVRQDLQQMQTCQNLMASIQTVYDSTAVIKNTGTTSLERLELEYETSSGTNSQIKEFEGGVPSGETASINLESEIKQVNISLPGCEGDIIDSYRSE